MISTHSPPLFHWWPGSVNAGNCAELAKKEDIDGFLVGGASLKVWVNYQGNIMFFATTLHALRKPPVKCLIVMFPWLPEDLEVLSKSFCKLTLTMIGVFERTQKLRIELPRSVLRLFLIVLIFLSCADYAGTGFWHHLQFSDIKKGCGIRIFQL